MTDFLEAITTPLSTIEKQFPWPRKLGLSPLTMWMMLGALPIIEATVEVANALLEMPEDPSTTELLPEDGIEAMAPLLLMMLSLSPCIGLRGWALLNILGLPMVPNIPGLGVRVVGQKAHHSSFDDD